MTSRDRIIAATLELIEQGGLKSLNVARVAAASGVTRQTVYANFGTLPELVSQAMTGVVVEDLDRITHELGVVAGGLDHVVELLVLTRHRLRERPLYAKVLRSPDDNPMLAPDVMAKAQVIADVLLAPVFEREPGLRLAAPLVQEIAIRAGISVILFDSELTATDDGLRAVLRSWLGPAFAGLGAAAHAPSRP